jgi:hypothetical protein
MTRTVLALVVLVGACKHGDPTGESPPGAAGGAGGAGGKGTGVETAQYFELDRLNELDLLFVVSNSPGMAAKQKELARTLPLFFQELGKSESVFDLHVGVVTSDLGAGATGCNRPGGDRGIFYNRRDCGLPAPNFFLSSSWDGVKNFQGNLADVAACLVQVGETGCQFPHPLQAGRVALHENVTKENAGFVRHDAMLAIIFLADRDDCSADTDSTLFTDNAAFPMSDRNLRCSIEGHLCDGKRPPLGPFMAPLSSCQAASRTRLIDVEEIVDSIKAVKSQPEFSIMVAALAGWPDDPASASYGYGSGGDGALSETPLCNSDTGPARAALRFKSTVERFQRNGRLFGVCNADLSAPVTAIGSWIHGRFTGICLNRPPLDADPATPGIQPSCQTVLRLPASAPGGFSDSLIPACREGGPRPCALFEEKADCVDAGFGVSVDKGGMALPPGTQVQVKCAAVPEMLPPGTPPMCTGLQCKRGGLGASCDPGAPAAGPNQAIYRSDAPDCQSGLCLRPSRDIGVARPVDTAATCTGFCSSDLDCGQAGRRDPADGTDKRCVAGYQCVVPFEVGPLCCRKLCVCKDFLSSAGVTAPASCSAPPGKSVCENHP